MKKNPVTYPESDYRTEIVPEILTDGRLIYVASHPEVRKIRSQGNTPEEAKENLSDAFALYEEHCREHGLDMPTPQPSGVREVIWRAFPLNQTQAAFPQPLPTMSISQPARELGQPALKNKG